MSREPCTLPSCIFIPLLILKISKRRRGSFREFGWFFPCGRRGRIGCEMDFSPNSSPGNRFSSKQNRKPSSRQGLISHMLLVFILCLCDVNGHWLEKPSELQLKLWSFWSQLTSRVRGEAIMNVCFHILLFVVVRVLCGYSLSASVRSVLCSSTESVYMNLIYVVLFDCL